MFGRRLVLAGMMVAGLAAMAEPATGVTATPAAGVNPAAGTTATPSMGVNPAAVMVTAAGIAGDGTKGCADAIQQLIDANPNRELFFPDGTYLLDHPICMPAHPKKSVCLKLSAYAIFKAAPGWKKGEALVRMGAIHPANDIRTPGSWYWISGGILDGSGVADGITIEGGRESVICDLSMKRVRVGIDIKRGANGGSSDSDIRNVNIVGNGAIDSVGVNVIGYDNTFAKMRIAGMHKGFVIKGGGNYRDLHVLFTGDWKDYDSSVGFEVHSGDDCNFDFCYSDQFATGFKLLGRGSGLYDKCFCFWYTSKPGMKHVAFDAANTFRARVNNLTVWFKSKTGNNALLLEGKPGGNGCFLNLRSNFDFVNNPKDTSKAYRVVLPQPR